MSAVVMVGFGERWDKVVGEPRTIAYALAGLARHLQAMVKFIQRRVSWINFLGVGDV